MRNSALVLSWLRLVQAARNGEEQNTEAFLKAGQLYVRATRDIRQEEELLVWYDQELSHLLGFTDMTGGSSEGEVLLCDTTAKVRTLETGALLKDFNHKAHLQHHEHLLD